MKKTFTVFAFVMLPSSLPTHYIPSQLAFKIGTIKKIDLLVHSGRKKMSRQKRSQICDQITWHSTFVRCSRYISIAKTNPIDDICSSVALTSAFDTKK